MRENILELKKTISSSVCEKIIRYFDDEYLQVAGFVDDNTKSTEDRNVRNCKTRSLLHPTTFGQKIVSNYAQDVFFNIGKVYKEKNKHFGFKKLSQLDILKYEANDYDAGYLYHIDHGLTCADRSLSVSLCLNNDFEGGEFLFNLSGEELQYPQNIGDALAFPSNFMFPHQVKKVLTGTRYALIGWLI
jgi:predicted 2-oxoglutarate/Fe(II)-dependent dioxygenase YbiX